MNEDIKAKNLLLGNVCENCDWCIMGVDSLRCIKANKGDTELKPSVPVPECMTCIDWELSTDINYNPCAEIVLSSRAICNLT